MQIGIDSETIRRVGKGDRDAIGALFESYHLKIFRYLYYRIGDIHIAEDLASEVFVRLIRSSTQNRPGSPVLQALLYKIARNLAIDHYRKPQAQQPVTLPETVQSTDEPIDATVERRLDHQVLYKAVHALPFDQGEVIMLRFISAMSIAEAAQVMNCSEDAIKGLQRRALLSLRQVLSDWEVPYV